MKITHLHVEGLINVPMKTQVKSVLKELEGVSQINVDLVQGTVEVGYNPPTNEDQIRSKIEHIGCRIL